MFRGGLTLSKRSRRANTIFTSFNNFSNGISRTQREYYYDLDCLRQCCWRNIAKNKQFHSTSFIVSVTRRKFACSTEFVVSSEGSFVNNAMRRGTKSQQFSTTKSVKQEGGGDGKASASISGTSEEYVQSKLSSNNLTQQQEPSTIAANISTIKRDDLPCQDVSDGTTNSTTTKFGGSSTSATLGPDTTTGGDGSSNEDGGSQVLFPWRHCTSQLNRLIPGTREYQYLGPMGIPYFVPPPLLSTVLHVVAARAIRWPFIDIAFSHQKQQELADACAVAFQNCVACLVSRTFQVPLDKVNDLEHGKVHFNLSDNGNNDAAVTDEVVVSSKEELDKESNDNEKVVGETTDNNSGDSSSNIVEEEQLFIVEDDDLKSMMDQNLLDLYKNASKLIPRPKDRHFHDTAPRTEEKERPSSSSSTASSSSLPLSVLLDMEIQSAKLVNLHPVPILTRDAVKRHPQHQFALQKILQRSIFNRVQMGMPYGQIITYATDELDMLDQQLWQDDLKVSKARMSVTKNPYMRNIKPDITLTIVAQVLVTCQERFRVMENKTGLVTQGDPNARTQTVTHLVKFEMVHKKWFRRGGSGVGSSYGDYDNNEDDLLKRDYSEDSPWIITDWDDLLEGNIYY